MRSKQQPRPSYRWLNKEENDEGDEIVDSPGTKDVLRSGSTSPSPSSSSSSIHSLENVSQLAAVATTTQLLPSTLLAAAAAAAAAVAAGTMNTNSTMDQESHQTISDSLSQAIVTTATVTAESTSLVLSSSPSSSSLGGGTFCGNVNATPAISTSPLTSAYIPLLQPHQQQRQQHQRHHSDSSPFPLVETMKQKYQQQHQNQHQQQLQEQRLPTSPLQKEPPSPPSSTIQPLSSSFLAAETITSIASNLIDSHDDVEPNSSSIPNTLIHQYPSAERELASPRCQSRDSSSGGRCPSDDSNYSGNGSNAAPTPTPTSPVGITLPATLPPAAAAALLPPQSAAMAAYLNVAAAAAQQNRLLLGNPLAAAAGLVRAAQSPPNLPLSSPIPDEPPPALDFSTKRARRDSDTDSKSDNDAVNLSKSDNGPLDLSVGSRKRNAECDVPPPTRKMPRPTDYKQPAPTPVVSPWTSPMTPYFAAAVAAASLSPKNPLPVDWNGKNKMVTNDATKALEKMSEMTRLGGPENDLPVRPSNNQTSGGGGGRHSAWQSHWLNKGADAAKDVFKCVWCKQSFATLATLTTHMKETQHCGVNVPPSGNLQSAGGQPPHHLHHHHHQSPSSTSSNSSSGKSDLNLLIKETMPLPRKLVRGQDVWLGKGAEQTRQILKCMWCGQSFRSLAEMTNHMQQTQHYTNIISQEQIISWKSSEDGKGGGPGGGNSGGSAGNANSGPNSTVSAVLTCKVCDQAFSSLKDLSNHMVKNAHYKEHIMRSITESGGRRRQTREKRKKSLPVRKLLELERAQHEFKNGEVKSMRDIGSTRITCEKCGDKIETALFVEHIRQCVGGSIPNSPRGMLKSSLSVNSIIPPDSMSPLTPSSRDGRKSIGDESTSPASNRHTSPHAPDIASPSPKETVNSSSGSGGSGGGGGGDKVSSSPSVLNAIEQLIEKSFDTRSRHGSTGYASNSHNSAPLGSSILKRLGIDESVDYTKPLIDPQTMNLLRTYQQHHYPKRERSGSESSSVSDRGSSRLESLTPERKPDVSNHVTPRQSPEKSTETGDDDHNIKVKKEPSEEGETDQDVDDADKISVKREPEQHEDVSIKESEGGELDLSAKRKTSTPSSSAPSPNQSAHQTNSSVITSTPAPSPGSDRSITPRSSTNSINDKKLPSGSLNALSSMFDSLTGSSSTTANASDAGGGHNSSKKSSSHPLAALQKLCDKTETTTPNPRSGGSGSLASNIPQPGGTASGAILAFSWACNDAVMTSDSIIKCAFCDTPFCSKGAYRHHLSKVHFVKDDVIIDPVAIKSTSAGVGGAVSSVGASDRGGVSTCSSGGGSVSLQKQQQQHQHQHQHHQHNLSRSNSQSPKSSAGSSNATSSGLRGGVGGGDISAKSPSPSQSSVVPPSQSPFEESPHSKFLKYTELAKQLSSKYV